MLRIAELNQNVDSEYAKNNENSLKDCIILSEETMPS